MEGSGEGCGTDMGGVGEGGGIRGKGWGCTTDAAAATDCYCCCSIATAAGCQTLESCSQPPLSISTPPHIFGTEMPSATSLRPAGGLSREQVL